MFGPSKYPLQIFSLNSSSPSTGKIKTLIQTLIFDSLLKAKTLLVEVFEKNQQYIIYLTTRRNKKTAAAKKLFFGSFRMHYNWCSSNNSHVMPAPVLDYYDPTSNSVLSTAKQCCDNIHDNNDHNESSASSQLSDYLQWLEAKKDEDEVNENIDRIADMFIENCHEKFRLEKVESYRRFQEMLARGI